MKKMKRILAAGLMLLALAGCGNAAETKAEYPAMEPLDISKMELATVENGTAKYQYDADVWTTEGEVVNSLVLYARDTVGTEKPVAINVQIAGERKKALDEDLMNQVLEQLEKNASLTVEKCELRSFDGNPVIYMENSFTFNDAVIDQMIENELWTEESLEQAGGRETILAIPDSHSIVVYGILDGNLVIYGGTYYEDAQKQEVLDAINIMLQTTEIE